MNATVADLAQAACPVQGQPDLYGLGIRVALYIQIFTVQISGYSSMLLGVDDNISNAVVVFILAVGTVLLRQILRGQIEAVEVFPILSLLIVQLVSCRVPYWRRPTTILLYLGEGVGLLALSAWFWFRGMETLPKSCGDDYAFFFAKVSIWHWYRKLNMAFSVMTIIGGVLGAVVYVMGLVTVVLARFLRKRRGEYEYGDDEDEDKDRITQPSQIDITFNIGIVVYVEMAIKWNHISGVSSLRNPGQFMPFFIALAQLVATLYRLGKYALIMAAVENDDVQDDHELECPHKETGASGVDYGVIALNNIPGRELPLEVISK